MVGLRAGAGQDTELSPLALQVSSAQYQLHSQGFKSANIKVHMLKYKIKRKSNTLYILYDPNSVKKKKN